MTTPSNKLFTQGQVLAQELFDNEKGDIADAPLPAGDDLPDVLTTWLFGYLLKERTQLDVKTKVLLIIAMATAGNQEDMLRRWIPAARKAGCDRTEVQETMVTLLVYAGWPASRRALEVLACEWPIQAT